MPNNPVTSLAHIVSPPLKPPRIHEVRTPSFSLVHPSPQVSIFESAQMRVQTLGVEIGVGATSVEVETGVEQTGEARARIGRKVVKKMASKYILMVC
jgi:hypothetical protein